MTQISKGHKFQNDPSFKTTEALESLVGGGGYRTVLLVCPFVIRFVVKSFSSLT
jgi:hypothetical protein